MTDYSKPFPDSIQIKVARPTGLYAHENFPESRHAIDFLVDVGTLTSASRDGRVFKIKQDSDKHFTPKDLQDVTIEQVIQLANEYTNFVCIQHEDGTYAEYLHLGKDGVVVEEGQEVKEGGLLGYTGWSGVMDKPVLHFNVFRVEDGKAISIPTNLNDLVRDK